MSGAAAQQGAGTDPRDRVDPRVCLPLLGMHAACGLVYWTGVSPAAVGVCGALYFLRVFGLGAGYHRYLSHRAFRTSRAFQLVLALLGASAAQLGPLWWAGHHRRHHAHTDVAGDPHSPVLGGFWWAHLGWLLCRRYGATDLAAVPDLARYPELVFLDRHPLLPPLGLALLLFGLGALLEAQAPSLATSGAQLLVWGGVISTVLVFHTTMAVNSVGHRWGRRDFEEAGESRNMLWLALPSLGDGWHNNHHRYPASARAGFRWWQLDLTYGLLCLLEKLGVVWDLRQPPAAALAPRASRARRRRSQTSRPATLARQSAAKASPRRA